MNITFGLQLRTSLTQNEWCKRWFRRMLVSPLPDNVSEEGTYPEDHEKVCARTVASESRLPSLEKWADRGCTKAPKENFKDGRALHETMRQREEIITYAGAHHINGQSRLGRGGKLRVEGKAQRADARCGEGGSAETGALIEAEADPRSACCLERCSERAEGGLADCPQKHEQRLHPRRGNRRNSSGHWSAIAGLAASSGGCRF
ncbi:hypothetical protein OBBRIDRAFT_805347 [Obba rivulosa]|uniref:Uncharacterized protein n=1 Tax=Obba rivulosa TaxID=1052685 RepID=A0A8E2DMV3_9APHY|nr:hypothetical protein OBBRIDRAFT_805347 [Obba rivulosa]